MKKILAICICLVLCLGFSACGNKSEVDVPMGMQLASDESIPDYILMVPDDWTVEESTGTTTAYYKDNLSGAVIATFTASFSVPGENITIDNYFESFSDGFAQIFGEDDTKMESSSTKLGGEDAKQYIYTANFNGLEYKFWQVFCLHEGRMYTLTYSTPSQYFDKFAEDMELIIEYFSFK